MFSNKDNKYNFIFLLILIVGVISTEIFLFKKFNTEIAINGANVLFILLVILFIFVRKLEQILLLLYFAPLLLLNNSIHYGIINEIIFALPLGILIIYNLYIFILQKPSERNNGPISKFIIIFLIYSLFLSLYGYKQGFNRFSVFIEFFHLMLYGSIFLFKTNLQTRESYKQIFMYLAIIFIIIAIQYIILGYIGTGNRFVTFQSGFLPALSGFFLIFFLYEKIFLKKMLYGLILIISLLGTISTLTRTLLVVTLITLFVAYILIQIAENKFGILKKIVLMGAVIIGMGLFFQISSQLKSTSTIQNSTSAEERAKSISNPTEDHSFLMRVELGYYAFEKFLERPLFGWGFGDYLRYKILGDTKLKNIYLDNSYFYLLWKSGIIGFVLILLIYLRSLKVGYEILTNTHDEYVKKVTIGLLSSLVGLLFLSLLSPILVKYRTNVLFCLSFAFFEYEYHKLQLGPKHD